MSEIVLSGVDNKKIEKEYKLSDFSGKNLFYIFIPKIILKAVLKKPAILEII